MIAPRLRLVLLMLLVAVPLATAAGLNRAFSPVAFLLIGFALIVRPVRSRPRPRSLSKPAILSSGHSPRNPGRTRRYWRSGRSFSVRRNDTLRLAVRFPKELRSGTGTDHHSADQGVLRSIHSNSFRRNARVAPSIFTASISIGIRLLVSGSIVTIDPFNAKSASTRT